MKNITLLGNNFVTLGYGYIQLYFIIIFFFVFHELKFQIIIICLHIVLIVQTLIKFSVLNEFVHVFSVYFFMHCLQTFSLTVCIYLLYFLCVYIYKHKPLARGTYK